MLNCDEIEHVVKTACDESHYEYNMTTYKGYCYIHCSKFIISRGYSFSQADIVRDLINEIRNNIDNDIVIANASIYNITGEISIASFAVYIKLS